MIERQIAKGLGSRRLNFDRAAAELESRKKKNPHWRGVVVSPDFACEIVTDDETFKERIEERRTFLLQMQSYLLYWDVIGIPLHIGGFGNYIPPSIEYLIGRGIVEAFDFKHSTFGEHYECFRNAEMRNPGRWAMAVDEIVSQAAIYTSTRSLLVTLHDALPIPMEPVEFDKLIKFRDKRRSEALALRSKLEEFYDAIVNSADSALKLQSSLAGIARALSDTNAVLDEAGFRFQWAGLDARIKWEIDPKTSIISGLLSGLATAFNSVQIDVSAFLGGQPVVVDPVIVGAVVGVSSNLIPKIEISTAVGSVENNEPSNPYAYAIRVHKKFKR